MPEPQELVLDRRLKKGDAIIYPITRQENVIGLQKTIKEKMAIVSPTQPTSGYVESQVWIQPGSEDNSEYQTEWHRVTGEEEEWHNVPEND